jgi:hypothetical protein
MSREDVENKKIEELKELLKKENDSSYMSWLLIFILISLGGFGKNDNSSELAKVKEDVAELKGKMSIIEKLKERE